MKIGKFNISKTWLLIIIIFLLVIGYYVIKSITKSPTDGLILERIQKGEVLQQVSETGSVKATESIGLGFKVIGKIAGINVSIGDSVKKGDILAQLESSQLSAQLQSAKAALSYTASQYNSGLSLAKDNLQSTYNSAFNILNDTYTKIYNAYNVIVSLQNDYFLSADQEGIKVREGKDDIQTNMEDVKLYLDGSQTDSAIDSAILGTLTNLENIYNDLKIIRTQCDSGVYYSSVSSTSKTSIDTQKAYINTAITNLTASQTSISSYKISLKKAEDSTAEQLQANIDALQSQLNDSYLISPINGTVTELNIKRGQVVSPSQSLINLLSTEPFEVSAYIYEQDIVNVKIGDPVEINLVAFPKQTFSGKVLLIDPAETVVDNVVYYKVTIELTNQPTDIRSGMTADITIETNKKNDILRIAKNVITQIDGTESVQVFKNGKVENVTITTGLEGNDYFEITSGLLEGDEIVVGKK